MKDQTSEIVTASEIAEWAFCPEAWRLARTGEPSANQFQKDAGTAHHASLGCAERVAGGSILIGRILDVAALLALAAWVLNR